MSDRLGCSNIVIQKRFPAKVDHVKQDLVGNCSKNINAIVEKVLSYILQKIYLLGGGGNVQVLAQVNIKDDKEYHIYFWGNSHLSILI